MWSSHLGSLAIVVFMTRRTKLQASEAVHLVPIRRQLATKIASTWAASPPTVGTNPSGLQMAYFKSEICNLLFRAQREREGL